MRPKLRIIHGKLKKIISKKRNKLVKTKKSKNNEENKLIKIRAAPNSRIKLNFLALILILIKYFINQIVLIYDKIKLI